MSAEIEIKIFGRKIGTALGYDYIDEDLSEALQYYKVNLNKFGMSLLNLSAEEIEEIKNGVTIEILYLNPWENEAHIAFGNDSKAKKTVFNYSVL